MGQALELDPFFVLVDEMRNQICLIYNRVFPSGFKYLA